MRLSVLSEAGRERGRDLALSAQRRADKHEAVAHEGGLVQLNNLQQPGVKRTNLWSVAITYVFCTILHYLEG